MYQVNGQYIEWKQLQDLYEKLSGMSVQSHGLSLVPKLKREHVYLTSFSRMRVDLAAQVILSTFQEFAQHICNRHFHTTNNSDYVCIIISQALSKSVSDAFKYFGDASTTELKSLP